MSVEASGNNYLNVSSKLMGDSINQQKSKAKERLGELQGHVISELEKRIKILRELGVNNKELNAEINKLEEIANGVSLIFQYKFQQKLEQELGHLSSSHLDHSFDKIYKKIDKLAFSALEDAKIEMAKIAHSINRVAAQIIYDTGQITGQNVQIDSSIKGEIEEEYLKIKQGKVSQEGISKTFIQTIDEKLKNKLSEEKNWKTIEKRMEFPSSQSSESRITPFNLLEGPGAKWVPGLRAKATQPSSKRATSAEIVNGHISEYHVERSGKLIKVFDGARSAVLSVDRKMKNYQEVNRQKAYNLLHIQTMQQLHKPHNKEKLDKIEKYITLINQGPSKELDEAIKKGEISKINAEDGIASYQINQPLEENHTTMGLLTLLGKEEVMWEDEKEALLHFNGKVTDFTLNEASEGKAKITIPCKWNINLYNFGVAEISSGDPTEMVKKGGFKGLLKGMIRGVVKNVTSMKKNQDALNEGAIKQTLNRYNKYKEETKQRMDELEKKILSSPKPEDSSLKQLKDELNDLKDNLTKADALHTQLGDKEIVKKFDQFHNAYVVPARILLLESIMGGSVHYHCKSGKDRTGLLDIEVKYLAQQLENTSKKEGATYIDLVAEKKNSLKMDLREESDNDRALRNQIAYEGGNLDIAEANTGERGLKTVFGRYEGMEKFGSFAILIGGQSKYVRS